MEKHVTIGIENYVLRLILDQAFLLRILMSSIPLRLNMVSSPVYKKSIFTQGISVPIGKQESMKYSRQQWCNKTVSNEAKIGNRRGEKFEKREQLINNSTCALTKTTGNSRERTHGERI